MTNTRACRFEASEPIRFPRRNSIFSSGYGAISGPALAPRSRRPKSLGSIDRCQSRRAPSGRRWNDAGARTKISAFRAVFNALQAGKFPRPRVRRQRRDGRRTGFGDGDRLRPRELALRLGEALGDANTAIDRHCEGPLRRSHPGAPTRWRKSGASSSTTKRVRISPSDVASWIPAFAGMTRIGTRALFHPRRCFRPGPRFRYAGPFQVP